MAKWQRSQCSGALRDLQRPGCAQSLGCDLNRHCQKDVLYDEVMAFMAEDRGVKPNPACIGHVNTIHLKARAEAYRLAAHYMDDDVQAAFDQKAALLAKRRANGRH